MGVSDGWCIRISPFCKEGTHAVLGREAAGERGKPFFSEAERGKKASQTPGFSTENRMKNRGKDIFNCRTRKTPAVLLLW